MSTKDAVDELDRLIQQRVDAIMTKVGAPKAEIGADEQLLELMAKIKAPEVKRCDEIEEYLVRAEMRGTEEQKPETQQYVRDLMRTCFQVEEEAAKIKGKYVPTTSMRSMGVSEALRLVPPPAKPNPVPMKTLSKPERLVLASATATEEQAEDALLALSLLQQYKKDPNFIQKELKDQAKRRDLVLGSGADPVP